MKHCFFLLISCISIFFIGCGSTSVERVKVDKTIDLSGKWNDTDSRLVSEEMIKDVISRPWHQRFVRKHQGRLPTVVVGTVRNRSHEHINTRTFVNDLERAMINSGQIDFVAGGSKRQELRDEVKEQASNASEATAKQAGEETGADFMLTGEINTILDRLEGKQVMYYQINLELTNIQTHRKVWIGEKKIKKFIEQSRLGI